MKSKSGLPPVSVSTMPQKAEKATVEGRKIYALMPPAQIHSIFFKFTHLAPLLVHCYAGPNQMALHPRFPVSPYAPLIPEQRWFPADGAMRATAYEKLLPPLVAKIRKEVYAWRNKGYPGASATSVALLKWWFATEHHRVSITPLGEVTRVIFLDRAILRTVGG